MFIRHLGRSENKNNKNKLNKYEYQTRQKSIFKHILGICIRINDPQYTF